MVSATDVPELARVVPEVLEVGNGGESEVSVVANRVGLKRLDDAWDRVRQGRKKRFERLNLSLPHESVISEVF